jgi:photosystem II stability/assembly factor-like uncharacterized protein
MTVDTVDSTYDENEAANLVYAVAASPNFSQDGICFAAHGEGMERSADAGETWQPAYASLNIEMPPATTALALSPDFANDGHVFAGTQGGVLLSIDGGQTWYVTTLSTPAPLVSALAASPNFAADATIFAATTDAGVYRSTDRGRTWVAWNFGLLDRNVFCVALSPNYGTDATLFIGTESGVFRSINGGRSWRETSFPTEMAPVLSLACAPDLVEGGALLAGTEASGLWQSTDQGRTWTQLAPDEIAGGVNALVVPSASDVLAIVEDSLLLSHDGGETWVDVAGNEDDADATPVTAVAAPNALGPGAVVLAGELGGTVRRVTLPA